MSHTDLQLSEAAVRLALACLEAPLPRLSAAVMRRRPTEAAMLSKAGFLSPGGHEPVTTASDDFSDVPLALTWNQDSGSFGYFSETQGWRDVPYNQMTPHDVDVIALLNALTQKCNVTGKPQELVPSYFWHLGLMRLDNHPRRIPLLFGRRLGDAGVFNKVVSALRNLPSQDRKVILTSTDTGRIQQIVNSCNFVSIQDVLDWTSHRVNPLGLAARLGHENVADSDEPVRLMADGKTVVLLGVSYHLVKGIRQRELVRLLYQYYLKGEHPVSSAKLLENLEAGDHTRIKDLFNKSPVWGKLLMEKHGMCGFCLPGLFDVPSR